MHIIRSQSTSGLNFDGSANRGRFSFGEYAALEKSRRLCCESLSLHVPVGSSMTWLVARFVSPSANHAPILVGAASLTQLEAPDGTRCVRFCPGIVPRDDSGFWPLVVTSGGIVGDATITLVCHAEEGPK
jgi:hypothetical protein